MPDEMILLSEKESLTADEVAQILQVSKNTVYNLVKRDELASYHVGRKMRFTRADVQNYISRARRHKARTMESSSPSVRALCADAAGRKAVAGAWSEAGISTREGGPLAGGGSMPQGMPSATGAPQGVANASAALQGASASQQASRATGKGSAHAAAVDGYVIAGNDILGDMLANYLGAVEVPIKRVYEGSYRALIEAYYGHASAALVHLYDGATGQYNIPAVRSLIPGQPLQVVRLAKRRQGLIVKRGNPKGLRSWKDLLQQGVRVANREKGCGSRILLDQKLLQMGASGSELEGYDREFPSALTMASIVARGGADAGIGTERVYRQVEGVDFLPLQDEWLDIVLMGGPDASRVSQAIIRLARTRSFRAEMAAIAGYDTSHMGEVVYEQ